MDLREPPQFSSTHLEDGPSIELCAEKHTPINDRTQTQRMGSVPAGGNLIQAD